MDFYLKICLTNLGKYNEGELVFTTLPLPFSEDELAEALKKIGINEEYEEFFISDYEYDHLKYLEIGVYEDIHRLNELAEMLVDLHHSVLEELDLVMDDIHGKYSVDDFIFELENGIKDKYTVLYGVEDLYDLGVILIDDLCYADVAEAIRPYFNFGKYADDYLDDGTCITDFDNERVIIIHY